MNEIWNEFDDVVYENYIVFSIYTFSLQIYIKCTYIT